MFQPINRDMHPVINSIDEAIKADYTKNEMVNAVLKFLESNNKAFCKSKGQLPPKNLPDLVKCIKTAKLDTSQIKAILHTDCIVVFYSLEEKICMAEKCGKELQDLDLCKTDVTDKELAEILEECPNITSLNIRKCPKLTDNALKEVGKLKHLKSLTISENEGLSEGSLKYLVNVPLESLQMRKDTQFTDVSAKDLAAIKTLKLIGAGRTSIGNKGMKSLSTLPKLEDLDIHKAPITDEGLGNLTLCPALKKIKLRECKKITVDGLEKLMDIKSLTEVDIRKSSVKEENAKEILTLKRSEMKVVTQQGGCTEIEEEE